MAENEESSSVPVPQEPESSGYRSQAIEELMGTRDEGFGYEYVTEYVDESRYKAIIDHEKDEAIQKLSFLEEAIDKRIALFTKKLNGNQRGAKTLKFASATLAAIVTVLLGLNAETLFTSQSGSELQQGVNSSFVQAIINTVALFLSATISVVSALSAFFDYKDLWIKYTDSLARLESLKFTIGYLKKYPDVLKLRDVELLRQKFDEVMFDTNLFVVQVREDEG